MNRSSTLSSPPDPGVTLSWCTFPAGVRTMITMCAISDPGWKHESVTLFIPSAKMWTTSASTGSCLIDQGDSVCMMHTRRSPDLPDECPPFIAAKEPQEDLPDQGTKFFIAELSRGLPGKKV